MTNDTEWLTGFGNTFQTEAQAGALPSEQNSPQKAPLGLYAEQLSGSAFTAPRKHNMRSWLYRIQPSVVIGDYTPYQQSVWQSSPFHELATSPTPLRWQAPPLPDSKVDFIDGLFTYCGNGSCETNVGSAIHMYACNQSMTDRYFYNSDGDLLIVPEIGALTIKTELGILSIAPKSIALIPRGIKFQVILEDEHARGYILENYGAPFILPDLGPIGANGLADPRHFITPHAAFEKRQGEFTVICKYQSRLWQASIDHSPLDVVAWHGNYAPCQYDLTRFNTINSVSFDHPDPSIFTVLTSPTNTPGVANIDFVIFPERWMVAEHTFRPPYYHRNIMSECMGLINGVYDAKETGFVPGGMSIHNAFSGHGPDSDTFERASEVDLKPQRYKNTLAFMFESRHVWQVTKQAMEAPFRDLDYTECWQNLSRHFSK